MAAATQTMGRAEGVSPIPPPVVSAGINQNMAISPRAQSSPVSARIQSLALFLRGLAASIRGRFSNELAVFIRVPANGRGQRLAELAERLQPALLDQIDHLRILGGFFECFGKITWISSGVFFGATKMIRLTAATL